MPRKHSASRISTEAEIALPSLWEIVLTFEEEPDATREASTPCRQEFWPAPCCSEPAHGATQRWLAARRSVRDSGTRYGERSQPRISIPHSAPLRPHSPKSRRDDPIAPAR